MWKTRCRNSSSHIRSRNRMTQKLPCRWCQGADLRGSILRKQQQMATWHFQDVLNLPLRWPARFARHENGLRAQTPSSPRRGRLTRSRQRAVWRQQFSQKSRGRSQNNGRLPPRISEVNIATCGLLLMLRDQTMHQTIFCETAGKRDFWCGINEGMVPRRGNEPRQA